MTSSVSRIEQAREKLRQATIDYAYDLSAHGAVEPVTLYDVDHAIDDLLAAVRSQEEAKEIPDDPLPPEIDAEFERIASTPTPQPKDAAGRLMLNAYGRKCYDAGIEAGKREFAAKEQRAFEAGMRQMNDRENGHRELRQEWIDAQFAAYLSSSSSEGTK